MMTSTPDHEASPTADSADREPLERAERAIDEARDAAREALRDPSPGLSGGVPADGEPSEKA